jgi:predicted nucleic acid-binding protein
LRFWDSSAVMPLLLPELGTATLVQLYKRDASMVVWWGTELECVSALSRRERMGDTSSDAFHLLDDMRSAWREIDPTGPLRQTARRLLRTHSLTAADALQLAAALAAADGEPGTLELLTLDERLAEAAQREGFPVGPQQQV